MAVQSYKNDTGKQTLETAWDNTRFVESSTYSAVKLTLFL